MPGLSGYFFAASVAGGAFFALSLIIRSRSLTAFLWAAVLLVFSCDIWMLFYHSAKLYREFPVLIGSSKAIPFLFGPLVYLFIASATSHLRKLRYADMCHFIPFLLYLLFLIPFFMKSDATRIFLFEHYIPRTIEIEPLPDLFFIAKLIHFAVYLAFSWNLVAKYQRLTTAFFSEPERYDVKWLYSLLVINSLSLSAYFFALGKAWLLPGFVLISLPLFFYVFQALWIAVSGIWLIKSPYLLDNEIDIEEVLAAEDGPQKEGEEKYRKTRLDLEILEQYAIRLSTYMEQEEPYLNPLITLTVLAKDIGIPSHHLSMVINSCFHENFYGFINAYRIKLAKILLAAPEKRADNILSVAYQTGFNSKSAFNTSFKKITGQTPTEFRKSL